MDKPASCADWIPSTPEIRAQDIERFARRGPLAIHFWAPWNRHDVCMDQSIQAVAPRFAGRVEFLSCNIDLAENIELCRRFNVWNIPAIGVLVAGAERRPIVGYREPDQLAEQIESRLLPEQPKPRWAF